MTARGWLLVALALGGLIAAAWAVTRFDLTSFDMAAIAERVRALGPLAPLALLALLVLQCVVAPLPSEPLMMAAGFLYGRLPGFALSWAGVLLGASACYALAAGVGRPVALRLVRAERLAALEHLLGARGLGLFLALLAVRAVAFSSFDLVSYGCGLLRMPFRWFALATAIGVVPKVFAFTALGTQLGEPPGWLAALVTVGTFGMLLAVPLLLRRWRRGALGDRQCP